MLRLLVFLTQNPVFNVLGGSRRERTEYPRIKSPLLYLFEPKGAMVEQLKSAEGIGRMKNFFKRYTPMTVVGVCGLVLQAFPNIANTLHIGSQAPKTLLAIALAWLIGATIANKISRKTSALTKSEADSNSDREIFEDLKKAFDDLPLMQKLPQATIDYYKEKSTSPYSFYAPDEKQYPILKRDEWIPDPAKLPNGIFPTLELKPDFIKNASIDSGEFGTTYLDVAVNTGQVINDFDIYSLEQVSAMSPEGGVVLDVAMSSYKRFVLSSQVLNPELLLALFHEQERNNSGSLTIKKRPLSLPLRNKIGIFELEKYVCKIGLSVLTVERDTSGDHFFIMTRSQQLGTRPLEYPNATHVVPAGTVQPLIDNFHDDESLLIKTTLFKEFAEEFFNSSQERLEKLKQDISSAISEVKFIITGMGIDAATQKFEITGLLIVPEGYMTGFSTKAAGEGRNAVVSREELIKCAEAVEKIIPAGAMAIFQGLKYLDSISR